MPQNHRKSDEIEPLLSRQRQASWENDAKMSAKKPSPWYIIIPLFALTFSFGALYAPMIEFYTVVFCYRYYQSQTGDSTDIPLENCNIPEVQSIVSQAQAIIMFLTYGSTLLVAGYYGALSDRKGRRLVLIISCLGNILLVSSYIVTIKFPFVFGVSLLFIFPVIRGLMAGDSILLAAAQAYITDCTTPAERTIAFGNMFATVFLGTTVGPTFSSFLIKETGSITDIFYLVLGTSIFFELYVLFILPESHDYKNFKPLEKENQSFLQRINVFSALQVLFRSSTKHANRFALPLIAGSQFFITIIALPPLILYAMLQFQWTSYEGGLFVSLSSFCKLIILVFLLPFLSKLFHKNKATGSETDDAIPASSLILDEFNESEDSHHHATSDTDIANEELSEKDIRHIVVFDSWMIRVGMFAEIGAFILFGLATTSECFTITIILQSFATLAGPSLRSLTTTLVTPNEVGEVLGAIAVVESCGMIVSQLTLNTIYSASVGTMPELVFYICAVIAAFPLVFAFFVKPSPLPAKTQQQA